MAEAITRDGTWSFDGDVVRIVPGRDRKVHKLRQALGEVAVPLSAIAGAAYEPGRKGGRLRLRLRDGADPLSQAARGQLSGVADPYQLAVGPDRSGVAEYFADEVRNALVIEGVPDGPADRYLLPGPRVPLTAAAGDGTVDFDGETVRLEWNWLTEESKKASGVRRFALADLTRVEWAPTSGLDNGYLRFVTKGGSPGLQPKHDPNCLTWGIRTEGGTTVLVAAAVIARLPHPAGDPQEASSATGAPERQDPDALLRRLRELAELHREGILTDEEFTAAKRVLLGGSGAPA